MLFRQDLQQIDWETILSPFNVDPSSMATKFLEIFESILNSHSPLRRKRVRNDFAPWLSASLRKLMLKRDRTKRLARSSPEMWSSYKQLRNQVTKEIRLAVSNYYHGLIKENSRDPKKMWKQSFGLGC